MRSSRRNVIDSSSEEDVPARVTRNHSSAESSKKRSTSARSGRSHEVEDEEDDDGGGRYPMRNRVAKASTLKDVSASDVEEDDVDDRKARRMKKESRDTGLNGRRWHATKPDHKRSRREVVASDDDDVMTGVRITRHGVYSQFPLTYVPDEEVGQKQHSTRLTRAAASQSQHGNSPVGHRLRTRQPPLATQGSDDDFETPKPKRVDASKSRHKRALRRASRAERRHMNGEGDASDGDSDKLDDGPASDETDSPTTNSGSSDDSADEKTAPFPEIVPSGDEEEDDDGKRYNLRVQRDPALPYNFSPSLDMRRQPPSARNSPPVLGVRPSEVPARRRRGPGMFSSSDSDSDRKPGARKEKVPKDLPMPINIPGLSQIMPGGPKARADVDPLAVDGSVTWSEVGGLETQVEAVKEMVLLPLLYPEVFERFRFTPPRGVLFYGPPGTGKTLVARALANACTADGQRVAFFMRKGADCLSKWVGEAERQLRLLFEQAKAMQPAIIFFDEIDGLAPVRSMKVDQVHSSIVSTLLALMDGLDNRGQVVVIGATNRLDAIDPALRRPGRFDRELGFQLPNKDARRAILDIHSRHWSPSLTPSFKDAIAAATAGYCGADLKALCTEATLNAVRRRYPQIYASTKKLLVDPAKIKISLADFVEAFNHLIPSSHRSSVVSYHPLPVHIAPLLESQLHSAVVQLTQLFPVFPLVRAKLHVSADAYDSDDSASFSAMYGRVNSDACTKCGKLGQLVCCDACPAAFHVACIPACHPQPVMDSDDPWTCPACAGSTVAVDAPIKVPPAFLASAAESARSASAGMCHFPRFLLCGDGDSGVATVGEALLHKLEEIPIHSLDMPSLIADPVSRTVMEALVRRVTEARKTTPCVLYLPRASAWWDTADESVRACLEDTLNSLPPSLPMLLLAVAEKPLADLDNDFVRLMSHGAAYDRVLIAAGLAGPSAVLTVQKPSHDARVEFLKRLMNHISLQPFAGATTALALTHSDDRDELSRRLLALQHAQHRSAKKRAARGKEVLPEAPPRKQTGPNYTELIREREEKSLAVTLRNMLRGMLDELRKNRRLLTFDKPVDLDDVPDYYEIIKTPMDFSTMMDKIERGEYLCYEQFYGDILLIQRNAQEYNPRNDPASVKILQDAARIPDLVEEMAATMDARLGNITEMCRKVYRDKHGCDFDPKAYVVACMAGDCGLQGPSPPVGDGHDPEFVGGARTTRAAAKLRGESVEVFPDFIDFVDGSKAGRKKRKKGSAHEGGDEVENHVATASESKVDAEASAPEVSPGAQPVDIVEPEEVAAVEEVEMDLETVAKLEAENAKFRDLHAHLEAAALAMSHAVASWGSDRLERFRGALTRKVALLPDKSPHAVANMIDGVVQALCQ